ncbi:unnamed protein product [Effrenium voratum]|nr:unnamed protein product [Effrenium voratum]
MGNARQKQRKHQANQAKLQLLTDALNPGEALPCSLAPLKEQLLPCVKRLHKARLPVNYSDDYFQDALSSPWCMTASHQGILVGALICKEMEGGLRVQSLVAEVPRRGIGSKLLKALVQRAQAKGILEFSLHVHVRNQAAIALYDSMGFRTSITKSNYYHRSVCMEAPLDAHFMVKTLAVDEPSGAIPAVTEISSADESA